MPSLPAIHAGTLDKGGLDKILAGNSKSMTTNTAAVANYLAQVRR